MRRGMQRATRKAEAVGVEELYLSEQVRRHARAGPRKVNQRLQHLLLVQHSAHLGTVVRLIPTRLVKQGVAPGFFQFMPGVVGPSAAERESRSRESHAWL